VGDAEERELIVTPFPPLEVRLNAAVTAWFEFIDTVQLAVPEQAPDHPANVEPALGVAVNVTTVPVA
jgi:hypothetical protein